MEEDLKGLDLFSLGMCYDKASREMYEAAGKMWDAIARKDEIIAELFKRVQGNEFRLDMRDMEKIGKECELANSANEEKDESGNESKSGQKPFRDSPLDIVLYDKYTQLKVFVNINDLCMEDYPTSCYAPIGIVVVPSSWNAYGDGTCGVVSLADMSCLTPNVGSTLERRDMYFGALGEAILPEMRDSCVSVGTIESPTEDATGTSDCPSLPSDAFSGDACPTDSAAFYSREEAGYNPMNYAAPSPYLNDGKLNPAYVQTTAPSSKRNCLSDFDGKGNTEKLLLRAIRQTNWRWANVSIEDNASAGYAPAACCCWRYSTEGTRKGDWYLPAMGELGCAMARKAAINRTIRRLNEMYGTVGIELTPQFNSYWSSTETSESCAAGVNMWTGRVVTGYRKDGFAYLARAFTRL